MLDCQVDLAPDGIDGDEVPLQGFKLIERPALQPIADGDLPPPCGEAVDGLDVVGDAGIGGRAELLDGNDAAGGDGCPEPARGEVLVGGDVEPALLVGLLEFGDGAVVLP